MLESDAVEGQALQHSSDLGEPGGPFQSVHFIASNSVRECSAAFELH